MIDSLEMGVRSALLLWTVTKMFSFWVCTTSWRLRGVGNGGLALVRGIVGSFQVASGGWWENKSTVIVLVLAETLMVLITDGWWNLGG